MKPLIHEDEEAVPLLRNVNPELHPECVRTIIYTSIVANLGIFLIKLAAFACSMSLSVAATLLDSFVDIVSQVVIWYSHRMAKRSGKEYPVGRNRLSPAGILVCATLMFAGAVEVVKQAILALYRGTYDGGFKMYVTRVLVLILLFGLGLKLVLYAVARHHPGCKSSLDVQVIADDNRDDVCTTLLALSCFGAGARLVGFGWIDAVGAILISLSVAFSWFKTGLENMHKLVGVEASVDIVHEVSETINRNKHPDVELDWLRCYHLGNNIVVEVEIVMPGHFTLHQTHDVALQLQTQIETMGIVERAYVHVDYQHREFDEHKHHTFPFNNSLEWERLSPAQTLSDLNLNLVAGSSGH